jgi:cbb3-type cytochrome oxidase subunit 3
VHKELLAQSPLLALPIAALLIFFAVFVVVVLRTMAKRSGDYARAAALPLDDAPPNASAARALAAAEEAR